MKTEMIQLPVKDADAVEVFITDGAGQRYSGSTFTSIEAARAWLKRQPNRECLRVAVTAKFVLEDDQVEARRGVPPNPSDG